MTSLIDLAQLQAAAEAAPNRTRSQSDAYEAADDLLTTLSIKFTTASLGSPMQRHWLNRIQHVTHQRTAIAQATEPQLWAMRQAWLDENTTVKEMA